MQGHVGEDGMCYDANGELYGESREQDYIILGSGDGMKRPGVEDILEKRNKMFIEAQMEKYKLHPIDQKLGGPMIMTNADPHSQVSPKSKGCRIKVTPARPTNGMHYSQGDMHHPHYKYADKHSPYIVENRHHYPIAEGPPPPRHGAHPHVVYYPERHVMSREHSPDPRMHPHVIHDSYRPPHYPPPHERYADHHSKHDHHDNGHLSERKDSSSPSRKSISSPRGLDKGKLLLILLNLEILDTVQLR